MMRTTQINRMMNEFFIKEGLYLSADKTVDDRYLKDKQKF